MSLSEKKEETKHSHLLKSALFNFKLLKNLQSLEENKAAIEFLNDIKEVDKSTLLKQNLNSISQKFNSWVKMQKKEELQPLIQEYNQGGFIEEEKPFLKFEKSNKFA